MIEFFNTHFDKMLISFFVLVLIGICFFFAIKGIDGKAFDWATNAFGIFVGLLGGLITGVAIGKNMAKAQETSASPKA
jgi:membrane associated rhomboid family serine protease